MMAAFEDAKQTMVGDVGTMFEEKRRHFVVWDLSLSANDQSLLSLPADTHDGGIKVFQLSA